MKLCKRNIAPHCEVHHSLVAHACVEYGDLTLIDYWYSFCRQRLCPSRLRHVVHLAKVRRGSSQRRLTSPPISDRLQRILSLACLNLSEFARSNIPQFSEVVLNPLQQDPYVARVQDESGT